MSQKFYAYAYQNWVYCDSYYDHRGMTVITSLLRTQEEATFKAKKEFIECYGPDEASVLEAAALAESQGSGYPNLPDELRSLLGLTETTNSAIYNRLTEILGVDLDELSEEEFARTAELAWEIALWIHYVAFYELEVVGV